MRTGYRRSGSRGGRCRDRGSRATHVGVGAERARPAGLGGGCGRSLPAGSEAEQEAAQGPALQRRPGAGAGRSSGPEQRQQRCGRQSHQRQHRGCGVRSYADAGAGCGAMRVRVRSPGAGLAPAAPKPRLGAAPRRVPARIAVISARGLSSSGKLYLLLLFAAHSKGRSGSSPGKDAAEFLGNSPG